MRRLTTSTAIPPRRGTVLPLLALTITMLMAFIALAIDVGILTIARTEAQNACDAASLAAARVLNNRPSVAANDRVAARAHALGIAQSNINVYLQERRLFNATNFALAGAEDPAQVGVYTYDPVGQRFNVSFPSSLSGSQSWTAVRVKMRGDNPTFFAKVVGINSMPWETFATAVHRPRDIAFVVDFSGSMGFGSTHNWPYTDPGTATIEGMMNPDPAYPKFGHYSRYALNQSTSTNGQGDNSPASRPNPFRMRGDNTESYPPNNFTMETGGGPAMIDNYLMAPGDPSSVSASTAFANAFKMWNPGLVSPANTTTLAPPIYNFSSYNATVAAIPAPDNFDTQSDSPNPYVGDKWPRTDGSRSGSTAWSTLSGNTYTDTGVYTLQQYLNSSLTGTGGRLLDNVTLPGGPATALQTNNADGGNANSNYLDVVWERHGYDIDMVGLRGQTGIAKNVTLVPAADRFKGYSMGPGYYGKTFFVWPPDPRWGADSDTYGAANGGSVDPTRLHPTQEVQDQNSNWIADWRRRFFLRGDGVAFNPQVDDINRILFRPGPGHVLNDVVITATTGVNNTVGYYRINYAAVMAWLKRGPIVIPTNLRQGRILYYASMPDDVTESAAGDPGDKRFWRHYIHFALGVQQFDATNAPIDSWNANLNYLPTRTMAGVESRNTFGGLSNTVTTVFPPTGGATPNNRRPYMSHTDNINRPRAHFWFGSYSMFMFLERGAGENRPWYSGTSYESQCWQVKAAISSVIDDVRANHPNDNVGLSYFARRDNFNVPVAPMSQDWFTLKNVLFFRKDTVAAIKANSGTTLEHRPYNISNMSNAAERIPNGSGSTDSNSGMAVAFNLLSSSTALSTADYGDRGRRGAAKIVIFETDGIPNTTLSWSLTGSGVDTRYRNSGTSETWTGDSNVNTHGRAAIAVVDRIVAPTSTSGFSGFSTPNSQARVHAVAFGDLFDAYNGSNFSSLSGGAQGALRFLLRVQQRGNTSAAGDPPAMIPFEQIITGPYQRPNPSLPEDPVSNPPGRIEKMRVAYERIMQSGVQVTLIQ